MLQRTALAAALSFSLAHAAAAQTPATATPRPALAIPVGPFGSLYASSTAIHPDDENAVAERGLGGGVQLGWAFANRVAIVADAATASISSEDVDENYTLRHLDLGARYHFGTAQTRWLPFADAGLSLRTLRFDDMEFDGPGGSAVTGDLELSGPAFFIGGGLTYFAAPSLGLTGALRVGTGSFGDAKFDGEELDADDLDLDATGVRLNVGLVWFPRGRR